MHETTRDFRGIMPLQPSKHMQEIMKGIREHAMGSDDKDKCGHDILEDMVAEAHVDEEAKERALEALNLLEELECNTTQMYPAGAEFVEDMVLRREKWGEDMFCSEGQLEWLRKLHAKYC
jgi:hypothetical protein